MKAAKALGISVYKPLSVTYSVTLSEFSELATQFATEKFGHTVEMEARYDPEDNGRVGLYFKNFRSIPNDVANIMARWGSVTETTPYHNMDIFLKELFRSHGCDVEDMETSIIIYITTLFSDYVENDGPQAEKQSSPE